MTGTGMASLFGKLIDAMVYEPQLRRVTKYISPTQTAKVTRVGRPTARDRQHTLLFTFGRANYQERRFIHRCLDAKEPFPVKKLQIATWPKSKKR